MVSLILPNRSGFIFYVQYRYTYMRLSDGELAAKVHTGIVCVYYVMNVIRVYACFGSLPELGKFCARSLLILCAKLQLRTHRLCEHYAALP